MGEVLLVIENDDLLYSAKFATLRSPFGSSPFLTRVDYLFAFSGGVRFEAARPLLPYGIVVEPD
jgi:hypothetical protein